MPLPLQRKNHATNPSFKATSGTVNVRTNNFANPSFETNTTGVVSNWGTTGAGTLSRPTTGGFTGAGPAHSRMQWTTANTVIGGYTENTAGSLPLGTHVISTYVRVNRAVQRLQLVISPSSGAFTYVDQPQVVASVGVWTRLTATINVTTAGTMVARATAVSGTSGRVWAIGDQLDTDGWLADLNTTVIGTYFDGATAAAGDFTYAWVGTANASVSHQQAPVVTGYINHNAPTAITGYQTLETPLYGDTALRCLVEASSTFIWGTTVNAHAVVEGEALTVSYYVRPSTTRLFNAAVSWDAAQPNITGTDTSCPANVWTRVVVSGTVPPGATLATAYFSCTTASAVGETIDVDGYLFEKVGALDTYFDGSTEDAGWSNLWQGTAHASASTRDATGLWVDTDLTDTAHTILTVLGLGMSQSVTKIVRSDGKTTFPVPGWLRRLTIDADTEKDWTVPLGRPVTYTLFKDGIAIASRTVTVAAETGDIMDPLEPQGALKIRTTSGDPTALTLGSDSVRSIRHENTSNDREFPLGARYAISRPGVRAAAQQVPFVFNAHTNEVSDNLLSIVDQAPILLVRTLPSWGAIPPLIYTDNPIEENPFNRGRGGQFTQWTLDADAVAPVTRAVTAGKVTNAEVQANLAGRTHDSIKAASGTKRHVEIKANPLSLGQ